MMLSWNGPQGALRRRLRLYFKCGLFLLVVGGYAIYNTLFMPHPDVDSHEGMNQESMHGRRLEGGECPEPANPKGLVILYIIGVLWLFAGLAIVADEFFCPALDLIADNWGMSPDVAGATLMAAGGSSPELFTSATGTFLRSSVGFGAIVGSAVFNILFVVGVCALSTSVVMELNWYPMIRDSAYYTIVLTVLAIFFGVNTLYVIDWYEALILHLMYWLYVYIMYHNETVSAFFHSCCKKKEPLSPQENIQGGGAGSSNSNSDGSPQGELPPYLGTLERRVSFSNPSNFREGILTLLTKNKSILETTGISLVSKIGLTVEESFKKYDKDSSGSIDRNELKSLLLDLGCEVSEENLDSLFKDLDKNGDGNVDMEEFSKWFTGSKERLRASVIAQFKKFDSQKADTFEPLAVKQLLQSLGGNFTDEQVAQAVADIQAGNERGGGITLESFLAWYERSDLCKEMSEKATVMQEAAEGISLLPPSPLSPWPLFWYVFTIPQVFCFWLTIPDVRMPGRQKWVYLSFLTCLAWMGFICYFMVSWIEIVGATIGIPSVIMGLTFVAAGTSVPDMLSAIIVAKQGEADKAVSSSVGSNVFDITVGLAFPWLLFIAVYKGEPVSVDAGQLFISILVLILALGFMVGVVAIRGWTLPRSSGALLILGYFAYMAQQLAIASWGAC